MTISITYTFALATGTLPLAELDSNFGQCVLWSGSTGSAQMPYGTTAQRDGSPAAGYLRGNSNLTSLEWWNGATWATIFDSSTALSFNNVTQINGGPLYGNRIKNGNKLIAQRATSGTITAGTSVPTLSTGYVTVDRFYQYCTGANVSVAQVAGSDATNKRVQYTGAASVTAIGQGTRMESSETAHMAGQTCTYSVELANTLLTTVTWTAYYATSTDTFGTVGTPTKTQIATGTFTVNSSLTKYSAQIAVPAGATTGIEIVLTVGAQVSGTWTVGREDFRLGLASPTYFEVPKQSELLADCYRYYYQYNGNAAGGGLVYAGVTVSASLQAWATFAHPVPMRVVPTYVAGSPTFTTAGCTVTTVNPQTPIAFSIVAGLSNTPNIQASFYLTAGSLNFNAEIP